MVFAIMLHDSLKSNEKAMRYSPQQRRNEIVGIAKEAHQIPQLKIPIGWQWMFLNFKASVTLCYNESR
jgi:hypothetical protein